MDCSVTAHPDFYGVGIRVGFYMLWFAVLLAGWLVPSEAAFARNILLLYILATFIALVVDVTSANYLVAAEVYIVLLLVYCTYYAYIPLYLWRLVTGCSPFWDPARGQAEFVSSANQYESFGRAWSLANLLMQVAITIFQLWFWITGVHSPPSPAPAPSSCTQHAFFFAEVPLTNQLFIALNVIINIVLLIGRVVEILFGIGFIKHPKWLRRKHRKLRKKGLREVRIAWLNFINGLFGIAVASIVLAGIEMTIQWNHIDSSEINNASTAAQLIPLVVGTGAMVRVLWVGMRDGFGRVEVGSDTASVVVEETYERRTTIN
ncbi:hypothetical protein F503_06840 [Ophiostoma piceae UAMH 11346]|uniref:Uncharacterized protein n=1 Tax=Ophiostoma piceae (strain UAMH 11346) TaxID=1262450 RepID=S3C689_OPHP1|nr:hypothetical protein F503_06840 [Ophiostoma piceae UAMH 11346]